MLAIHVHDMTHANHSELILTGKPSDSYIRHFCRNKIKLKHICVFRTILSPVESP